MPGRIHRNLGSVLADLVVGGQTTAPGQPGQQILDLLAFIGALTTPGLALYPNVATQTTWIAIGSGVQAMSGSLTALTAEYARVPVFTTTGVGVAGIATAFLGGNVGNGWIWEMGAFQGGTQASGSGTLLAYSVVAPGPFLKHALKTLVLQFSVQ